MSVDVSDLRSVPLLKPIGDRELKKLASSFKERRVAAGDAIVEEGKSGVGFFIVLEGTAEASAAGRTRELGAGAYFGEMALLGADVPRSASVTAKTEVRLASLPSWGFKPLLDEHPELAVTMLETMATRLRDAEQRLRETQAL